MSCSRCKAVILSAEVLKNMVLSYEVKRPPLCPVL